ncbi:hypothetical protein PAXINDRAFT_16183 [Paxillus involutus ATCC 200175]|uniref:Uncharacterized protein n=1 Tax=Paxillus involutus ATCC 200175 TaxID=664439 RepID=A0A0C9TUB0_PAXIN|nr:hypothetical protein PAXINDRAFT_16183 [Paxillus involutus ATCC 200175]
MSNPQPYVHTPQAPKHPIKPHSEATSYIVGYSWTSHTYLAHVHFLEGLDAPLHVQVVASHL